MEIVAKKISKKSLFKLLFIGLTAGLSVFAIICGIAAFFGAETIQWNGVQRTGVEGLLYGLIMGPFLGLLFACFMWLFITPGLWVYSFFRPIRVTFKHCQNEQSNVV
jgi:hypothetical protein|tara:strand:- start:1016 stop:1336 length:321 start_codon:yes stop_codon:yes gene_type:complete